MSHLCPNGSRPVRSTIIKSFGILSSSNYSICLQAYLPFPTKKSNPSFLEGFYFLIEVFSGIRIDGELCSKICPQAFLSQAVSGSEHSQREERIPHSQPKCNNRDSTTHFVRIYLLPCLLELLQ